MTKKKRRDLEVKNKKGGHAALAEIAQKRRKT